MRLALATFLLITVTACGPTTQPECGPSSCAGCCDAQGTCQLGSDLAACGARGLRCDTCLQGQQCLGRCLGTSMPVDSGIPDAGCTPESDLQLCSALGTVCGPKTAVDRCGSSRALMCGTCSSTQACSNGQCVCQPESDTQLCINNNKTCGLQSLVDRCGRSRSVLCGTCTGSTTCGGGGVAGTCGCTTETDAAFCARNNRSCGSFSGTDSCGRARTVASCGSCISPNTCSSGTCTCPAENASQFCTRLGIECGSRTALDRCGQTRTINCGSCSSPSTCSSTNTCSCVPETDAAFCANAGKNCGSYSSYDTCGSWRTADCGTCSGTQTCGGGALYNVCGCTAESNAAFLSRLGKNCGSVTAPDNCGLTRTVNAGTCSGSNTCGGAGTPNVCGCAGQSDAQVCAGAGKSCGAHSGYDTCGTYRTIASCGTCSAPQTCGGGTTSSVCGCTPESAAAFCARLGATCGSKSGTDNCGQPLTVTNCGSCGSTATCSSQNVCTAWSEAFTPLCNADGWCFDHPAPFGGSVYDVAEASVNDAWMVGTDFVWAHWDGTRWTGAFDSRRPDLRAVWAKGSEVWAAGEGGLVVRRQGNAWVDVANPLTSTITRLFGFSGTDVWASSGSTAIHWNGTVWASFSLPSTINRIWGFTSTDVWAAGNGFLSRWNGTTWTTQPSLAWQFSDVHGVSASEVWAVAAGHVMRFNGNFWSDVANDTCSTVWVASATSVTLACSAGVIKQWNGTSWTSATAPTTGVTRMVGTGSRPSLMVGGGSLFRAVGSDWGLIAPRDQLTTQTVSDLQTFSGGEAIVLAGGEVLAKRGGTWSKPLSANGNRLSMIGVSSNDLYFGMYAPGSATPFLQHVVAGSAATIPITNALLWGSLLDVWRAPTGELFAAGNHYVSGVGDSHGVYEGTAAGMTQRLTFATTDTGFTSEVSQIHGSSSTNVWAVDRSVSIWRRLGGNWTRVTSGSPLTGTDRLVSLWVESDTQAWFGGNFGVLSYNDAVGYSAKQTMPVPANSTFGTVAAIRRSASQGFLSGGWATLRLINTVNQTRGVIWKWNGTQWEVLTVLPEGVTAIEADGTAVMVGSGGGYVFRKP